MPEEEAGKKRKRTPTEFVVLEVVDPAGEYKLAVALCANAARCREWIRDEGQTEHPYQIAAFKGAPISVNVETAEKRTLTSLPPLKGVWIEPRARED